LPPLLLAEIRRELGRLEFLLAQVAELEEARETVIQATFGKETAAAQTQHTRSLRV
jgi:hypothetical protein